MKPTRFYSNNQERQVAKAVEGKKTSNSGATKFSKGDVTTAHWLFECKTSVSAKSSFSIKREWLEKNRQEAFAMGKDYNALVFDYGNGSKRYYVVDEKTFLKMSKALEVEDGKEFSN